MTRFRTYGVANGYAVLMTEATGVQHEVVHDPARDLSRPFYVREKRAV